jgi:hypothetical protein
MSAPNLENENLNDSSEEDEFEDYDSDDIAKDEESEECKMNKENRWAVSYMGEHTFPYWRGTIPDRGIIEATREIFRQVYVFANDEDLYRLVHKSNPGELPKVLVNRYLPDFSERTENENGEVNYLTKDGLKSRDYKGQSKISYYHEGKILTEWVEDFLTFSRNLRPDKYEKFWDVNSGVYNSEPLAMEYGRRSRKEIYEIMLSSDIWFPRVVGWMDGEEPSYDNSELAALNAPRLNRFLQKTKEFFLKQGGTWEVFNTVDSIPDECKVTEDGVSLEVNTSPRNYWCVWDSCGHASMLIPYWSASFPKKRFKTIRDVWPLIKTILEVGQKEKIFRSFKDESDFQDFIYDVDTNKFPVPSLEYIQDRKVITRYREYQEEIGIEYTPTYLDKFLGDNRVCYYDLNGQITERYLHRLGDFLQQYHKDREERLWKLYAPSYEYGIKFRDSFLVRDWSDTASHKSYYADNETYFDIMLTSDIWFPKVPGFFERKHSESVRPDVYCDRVVYGKKFDNHELANRHTPSLNRFIAAIADKVREMGGEWTINPEMKDSYREMMTLTGIKLDV